MHIEIAIIGGGINGLAIAHHLAAHEGAEVAVFDDHKFGTASRAAAGFLGAQTEGANLPEEARPVAFPILLRSRHMHEFLDAHLRELTDLGSGYRRAGALHVASDELGLEALERRYGWQRAYGARVTTLSAREARSLAPSLSSSIAGAVYLPDEATVEPLSLLEALQRACDALGVRSIGERVRQVMCAGGRVSALQTDEGIYAVDAMVIAAGGWLNRLEGLPPSLATVQSKPSRTMTLRGDALRLGPAVLSAQGYVVTRADGSLILGSTVDSGNASDDLLDGLQAALAAVPALVSCQIQHSRGGYRPHAPGGLPWAGRTDVDGLFAATGNVRDGLLLAPMTAALVADAIEGGARPEAPFAPSRPLPATTTRPSSQRYP